MSEESLPLRQWPAGIRQASVPANENALRVQALLSRALSVEDDAPGTEYNGAVYIVGSAPTGAFSTFSEHDIALFEFGSWYAWAPPLDTSMVVNDVRKVFDGTEWVDDPSIGEQLTIGGAMSIHVTNVDGTVTITLDGDNDSPGGNWYYGTNAAGDKGWHAVSDTMEAATGELTKDVDADGVTTFGLADVADAGGGTLQRTAFDAKGRKTGTSEATTDDLKFADTYAPAYLKTVSDIENGRTVSIFRFINPTQIAGIKDRTSTYDAAADLQDAFDSGARGLEIFDGLYRIESGLLLASKVDFSLIATGSVLALQGAFTGLTVTGGDGVRISGGILFTGDPAATGFTISGCADAEFSDLRARGLLVGGVLGAPANKTYGGIVVPDQTRLANFYAQGCGTGLRIDGEYYELLSPQAKGCGTGLALFGGNASIVGGSINGNRVGVLVDGSLSTNGDHGRIAGATINHNLAAGVYVKDTNYSFHITGCDLWANIGDGTPGGLLSESGNAFSFGVYLQNCENINLSGNMIARNQVNVGFDGLVNSIIATNSLISDPTRSLSHIKEYGFAHSTFGVNAQNIIGPNLYEGTLLGGNTARVELLNSPGSLANRVIPGMGTTGSNVRPLDSSVSGAYVHDGNTDALVLASNCPATVQVSRSLFGLDFDLVFISVAGGTHTVEIPGATLLNPVTSGVTVSGTTLTFRSTGLYRFTATGNGRWIISCAGGNEPVVAPALTGAWANLAGFEPAGYWKDGDGMVCLRGTFSNTGVSGTACFTLPVGYRPALGVVLPAAADTGTAFVIVTPDGLVTPTYSTGATFLSISGLRFRPD